MTAANGPSPARKQADVYIIVSRDCCVAELVIPPKINRAALTLRHCIDIASNKGIDITPDVVAAVTEALAAEQRRTIIARSRCAIDGVDGRIKWLVKGGYETPHDASGSVDYYDRARLALVETDQVIARITDATEGAEGADVYGHTIKPTPGRPVALSHDQTLRMEDNAVIACTCGLLVVKAGCAHIREMIDIQGNVDFSTGHIDYGRDIRVRGGVFDRFEIQAGGHLIVQGLTEAATIKTGGDFEARGGMVGYPNGSVHIGGNLRARYLDSVTGHVTGELHVEREMIHCTLTVMRDVDVTGGAIIGGTLKAHGPVRIAMLGSSAGVTTTLQAGAIGHALDIRINRKLHPGVTLIAGAQRFYFNKLIRGPLRFARDGGGITLATGHSKPTPLTRVTGVS